MDLTIGDPVAKKIAVLVNEDTLQRCSCGGCLKAFMLTLSAGLLFAVDTYTSFLFPQ